MKNKVPFTMEHYRADITPAYNSGFSGSRSVTLDEIDAGIKDCGTGGCALGWAPFVIPPSEKVIAATENGAFGIDLDTYRYETFGELTYGQDHSVFGYDWRHVDNSREGAAFRLAQLANYDIVYSPNDTEVLCDKNYFEDRDAWVAQWEPKND